ncbi:HAD family hydrolase [bacterium]|nr:HAD family hydrolase [bacterium]
MTFLSNTQIEIINTNIKRGHIRHALFDFDGTISLIREGWQTIMIPMMVEILAETPEHKPEEELESLVTEFVTRLTGKQTIYQMIQLCEEVEKRGQKPLTPLQYKRIYLDRLQNHIAHRIEGLKSGVLTSEEMTVRGSLRILDAFHSRSITCYLASGTDEKDVLEEADLLGLSNHFEGIYGALDDYQNYSKKMVIDRIIGENRLHGPEFVILGDGYVEIEDGKSAGGIAVGVASNESERKGIDSWKRNRLIRAGADLIIPDFQEYDRLMTYLMMEE